MQGECMLFFQRTEKKEMEMVAVLTGSDLFLGDAAEELPGLLFCVEARRQTF